MPADNCVSCSSVLGECGCCWSCGEDCPDCEGPEPIDYDDNSDEDTDFDPYED